MLYILLFGYYSTYYGAPVYAHELGFNTRDDALAYVVDHGITHFEITDEECA